MSGVAGGRASTGLIDPVSRAVRPDNRREALKIEAGRARTRAGGPLKRSRSERCGDRDERGRATSTRP